MTTEPITETVTVVPAPLPNWRRIEELGSQAVRAAVLMHKKLGIPIVAMRDGKMTRIPAEEIVIDDEASATPQIWSDCGIM